MFSYEYLSTVDSKGHAHRYKVTAGDTVPEKHKEKARGSALLTYTIQEDARWASLMTSARKAAASRFPKDRTKKGK